MGDDRRAISGWIEMGCSGGWETGGSTCTSPLEDGPSTIALVFSTLWAGAEAQAVPWVPHPPGCRPRGSLQRLEGRRKKTSNLWTIILRRLCLHVSKVLIAGSRCGCWPIPLEAGNVLLQKMMWNLELHPAVNTPGGLPCKEMLRHNHSYSQESFCEMNTGVFSLKQI